MAYCTVNDLKLIFMSQTGGSSRTSGKFRIGDDPDDHLDTTSAEAFIEMAEVEINGKIRRTLATGAVPLTEPVVGEIQYATAFVAAHMIAESNYFGQRNVRDEGVGSFFKARADSLISEFISNYNAGIYDSTYSGVSYGPMEDKPDSTSDSVVIPPRYRYLFFNFDTEF